jgi:ubiquinone/menaquinone biosynthesis C-methylase UbiE
MTATNEHPDPFDPAESSGTLTDNEQRGRYSWAGQAAAGADVLDAACGNGYGSLILANAGARSVTGIDSSAEAVSTAQERLGGLGSVVQGDVEKLPFEADSFDLVVCLEMVEHVVDAAAAVAEFRRVLRPGGVLLISSSNLGLYLGDEQSAQANSTEVEHRFAREQVATLEREQAARKRLDEANERLLSLSEEIGRLRVLEKHFGELKGRELEVHYEVAVTRLNEIESSRAWKWVEALRRLLARRPR